MKNERAKLLHPPLGTVPVGHPDIRRILGGVHVATTYRDAIKDVVSRFNIAFWDMTKEQRRYIIAATIQHHAENKIEYAEVMRGKFGQKPRPRYWFRKEDKSVHIVN